jgi:hypothetical protein
MVVHVVVGIPPLLPLDPLEPLLPLDPASCIPPLEPLDPASCIPPLEPLLPLDPAGLGGGPPSSPVSSAGGVCDVSVAGLCCTVVSVVQATTSAAPKTKGQGARMTRARTTAAFETFLWQPQRFTRLRHAPAWRRPRIGSKRSIEVVADSATIATRQSGTRQTAAAIAPAMTAGRRSVSGPKTITFVSTRKSPIGAK